MLTSEQHLFQTIVQFDKTIVLPRKFAIGMFMTTCFCYCSIVVILFEVMKSALTPITNYTC